MATKERPPPGPDGRSSWIIAGVCFLISLLSAAYSRCSSLFFTATMSTFGVHRADAALPVSAVGGFYNLAGLFAGPLIHLYGVRRVSIAGGSLMAVGLISSYCAQGTTFLIVSLGFIYGSGYGILFASALVAINQYFERHRGVAQGINLTGATMASFVFPKMLEYLINQVGMRMTLLVLGVVLLNLPLLSLLLRPPPWDLEKVNVSCIEKVKIEKKESPSALESSRQVLSNPRFYFHATGYFSFSFFLDSFLTIVVDYAVDSGLSVSDAVFMLTLFSITDTVGRLLLPVIGDRNLVSHTTLMTISYMAIALLSQLLPWMHGKLTLYAVCLAFGLPMGYAIVGFTQVLTNEVGLKNLPVAYGFVAAITAVGSFARPLIIGYFRDSYGSYEGLFKLLGGMMTISFIFNAVLWTTERKKQAKYNIEDFTRRV
ncbi:monocarboxylate transporter 12-like isoform X2 [Ornithodoros turicata]|uniref:monocarboxylate transporter 12-like isoform X2 n=1 Tax=Ornithodoros turicata TaxID=34597 RepID=UPI00313A0E77